jgi:hypothetical protein
MAVGPAVGLAVGLLPVSIGDVQLNNRIINNRVRSSKKKYLDVIHSSIKS